MASGNVVSITINVTDGNAAESVQEIVTQLQALGPAGQAGGAEAAAGLDEVGEHALTSLDNVRLLRDDLGIHIPRSMEKAIASSELLSGAIGAMGSGLLALGAVEIFAHLGESIYSAYEKYIDINAAQKDFFETLQKNKDSDFINVHSIETATLRLNQATAAVGSYRDAAKDAQSSAFMDVAMYGANGIPSALGDLYMGGQMSHQSAKAMGQTQELSPAQQSLIHQLNMADIDKSHAADSALQGEAKITAELQKQLEIDQETQRYTAIQDRERGNPGGSDSGGQLRATQDAAARAKASAERLQLQRQETDQIIQMQNEATNAGLTGNALLDAQTVQSIDAILRKYQEGEISKRTYTLETAAVIERVAQEQLKQQEQLDQQTKKMAEDADQAGKKGIPLIQSQLQSQLGSIDYAEKQAVGTGGTETSDQAVDYMAQRVFASQAADQKIVESEQQFQERIRALDDSTNDYMLQGYAKIEGATQKHLDQLAKEYEQEYGSDQSKWTGYQQAITEIEADADRERQQLHQKTMEQIDKEEEQAARLVLPEWQSSMLQIEDEYSQRLRQIQQDVKQHVMTEQEGAQAVTAAWALESAQLEKNAEQTRDKLASSLQSLFSNPEQFFEKRAMDTAFQFMANELLGVMKSTSGTMGGSMIQWLFGMGPEMNTSTNLNSAFGSIFHSGGGMGGTQGTAGAATFNQAGTTLVSAGTGLNAAASALMSAATSLSTAGAGGAGGLGGIGSGLSGTSGWASSTDGVSSDIAGGGSGLAGAASGLGSDFVSASSIPALASSGKDGTSGWASSLDGVSPANGTPTAGQWMGAAGGALTGGMGIYSAYENSNPLAGAVSGAMGGAEIGGLFGPAGAVAGGIIGAIGGFFAGLFGDKGKAKAQAYDTNTVQPAITADLQEYNLGQSGYNSVVSNLYNLQTSAKTSTDQLGRGAVSWYNDHILPEINTAIEQIQQEERGGRSSITMSAAQYHTGGWIDDFGDFGTSPNEGFIHAMQGEFMVHSAAAQAHAPLLSAIQTGNVSYASSVQPRMPASASGTTVQLTIQAMDSQSVAQWAKSGGGRSLVAAMNQAQRQYSGVGRG